MSCLLMYVIHFVNHKFNLAIIKVVELFNHVILINIYEELDPGVCGEMFCFSVNLIYLIN